MRDWCIAWTIVAVVLLLVAEKAGSRVGIWLAKPAASLGFVAIGLLAPPGPMTAWLVCALIACALGDVLLIPEGRGPTFLAGVGAFALGHACYAGAFWRLDLQPWATVGAALLMLAIGWRTLRWLKPHVAPPLDQALRGYVIIIGVMVALAAGASAAGGDIRYAIGAFAFAVSDLSVARERFVHASFTNLVWGLPLYYAAQLLLASTL